jgi:hypothetical protein
MVRIRTSGFKSKHPGLNPYIWVRIETIGFKLRPRILISRVVLLTQSRFWPWQQGSTTDIQKFKFDYPRNLSSQNNAYGGHKTLLSQRLSYKVRLFYLYFLFVCSLIAYSTSRSDRIHTVFEKIKGKSLKLASSFCLAQLWTKTFRTEISHYFLSQCLHSSGFSNSVPFHA